MSDYLTYFIKFKIVMYNNLIATKVHSMTSLISSKVLVRVHSFYVPISIHAENKIIYIARIFRKDQLKVAANKVLTSPFD